MQDKLQILFDSYIALSAASAVTGLATYIYGVNKAYYDGESILETKNLTKESKRMVKHIKNFKRKLVLEESLKTFIPVYNVYNSAMLLVARNKLNELYEKHFTNSFEEVIDNESYLRGKEESDKAVELILKKRNK